MTSFPFLLQKFDGAVKTGRPASAREGNGNITRQYCTLVIVVALLEMELGQPKMTQKIPKHKKTKKRLMQTNETSNMVHLEMMIPCFQQKILLQNV